MNSANYRVQTDIQLQLELVDLMSDTSVGESAQTLGQLLIRLESIFSYYGQAQVFSAIETSLQLMPLSETKRTSVLIVLLRTATLTQSSRVDQIREQLFSLLDVRRVEIMMEAYCADINRHIWTDRADLAVGALLEHFNWLEKNDVQVPCNLYLEAAFACNRFEKHLLAADFSYAAYNLAIEQEDKHSIDRAAFFILNSNRLANFGGQLLLEGYGRQVAKLESGKLDLFAVNQYLMPMFACFAELASESPNAARVERLLTIAKEIGQPDNDYCRKALLVGSGLQSLLLGRTSEAQRTHDEIWQTTHRQDRAVDQMAELLAKKLNSHQVFQAEKKTVAASNRSWLALAKFAVK